VAKKSKFETLWTPIMSRRIEGLFDGGGTIVEASRLMGINRSTFNRWANSIGKEKQQFREIVEIGKEAAEAWWIRQGRENLDTRGFNHGLWLMNMVNRFGWTSSHSRKEEKKEIAHSGTVEVKKKVDVDAILEKAINMGIKEMEKSIH
jgi:hypothetical protein